MNNDSDHDYIGDRLLEAALMKVTKKQRKEKKPTKRGRGLSPSALKRLYEPRYREISIKDAADRVMEQAYMRASASNTLPANARQVMYQARPLIQHLTEKPLKDNYFTQTLLPDFIKAHPELTGNWDVVYDARGHLEEPHTGKRVDLGTVAVRRYVANWATEMPDSKLNPISLGVQTLGPANRFKFALFIEKEGFSALFDRAEIGKRYDIAIMSTKGMSVTASRRLVESLTAAGVTTLVVHDFDESGFTICHTLQTDTERYQFTRSPNVECLGLRLTDVQEMGLESESVDYRGTKYGLKKCGATSEEVEFLAGGERVELNAMDSGQFIEWPGKKFQQHGVKKVIPDRETLESAYKLGILTDRANLAIAKVQEEWDANGHEIEVPGDLETQISSLITENANLSWDEAIKIVEGPPGTPEESLE